MYRKRRRGSLFVFVFLCMRQPCGKYGEYDFRVHLCAQPLDGSFGQPQGTLGLLALYRGMGAALQLDGSLWLQIAFYCTARRSRKRAAAPALSFS